MTKHVIETENLIKEYKSDDMIVKAVRGISLSVEKGEFTAIAGPSGSGKTTFLNIISGLDTPTQGKILLNNRNIADMDQKELADFRRDNIGFIFQAYNLIPVLTVEENIEYIMLLQGIDKSERRNRVTEILKTLKMKDFHKRLPSQLSGGQQQRVAIARAMVSEPSLILADEPTANLDSSTSESIMDTMKELNEKTGMTFIFSTHDNLVMQRARRLITLKDGKINGDIKQ